MILPCSEYWTLHKRLYCYVWLYFLVFDFVSIWYLFSLFLTLYSMYLCILYMSPLYINMFLYFSISLFYLSYFTWLYCVCPPFLKTVFFLSWITFLVMHVYFVFQTMYIVQVYWNTFCSVLFCYNLCPGNFIISIFKF